MPPGFKSEVPELLFWIAVVALICLIHGLLCSPISTFSGLSK